MRLSPMSPLPLVFLLALGSLTGCGLKKDLEAVQAQLAESQATVEARDATIAARETEIARLEGDVSTLDGRIKQLEDELRQRAADLESEREKTAAMLSDRGRLREEVAAMKTALAELQERKRQAEARVAAYKDLVARFQSLIDAGTLNVKIVDGRMVVVLATDILFASGSADLSDDGKAALTTVSEVLASIADRQYQVEGHTDDVPIKTSRYPSNWYLAAARAIGVVDHMIATGMPAARISAASYGQTRPVAANDTPENKASNRRIEIVVVPDLSDLPGYDELQQAR